MGLCTSCDVDTYPNTHCNTYPTPSPNTHRNTYPTSSPTTYSDGCYTRCKNPCGLNRNRAVVICCDETRCDLPSYNSTGCDLPSCDPPVLYPSTHNSYYMNLNCQPYNPVRETDDISSSWYPGAPPPYNPST